MKLIINLLLLFLVTNAFTQNYTELEKLLLTELPANSTKDGRWVFYPEKANIKEVEKKSVQNRIPGSTFFQLNLTNYLGYHQNEATCLVLYDTSKSKITLVEPLWYGDVSVGFTKLIIGEKFETKESLLSFLQEFHELLEIGSGYKFILYKYSDIQIIYDMVYYSGDSYTTGGKGIKSTIQYSEEGVWRRIEVDLKDFKIKRYTSINPKMGERVIIK